MLDGGVCGDVCMRCVGEVVISGLCEKTKACAGDGGFPYIELDCVFASSSDCVCKGQVRGEVVVYSRILVYKGFVAMFVGFCVGSCLLRCLLFAWSGCLFGFS